MFYILYIIDDSRKKTKVQIYLFFFLNGWRSLLDEGIRNENFKRMKTQYVNRQREREIKGGSELHNERRITNRKALPTAEAPTSHLPTSLLRVTLCEMENRATDTVVHSVVNNHQVRNSEGDLTLRLSMQGSTLGFVI